MPTLIQQLKQLFPIPEVYFSDNKKRITPPPCKGSFAHPTQASSWSLLTGDSPSSLYPCLLYPPTSASSAQPHPHGACCHLATAQRCVSPAFSAGNPLHPTQCRAEASLLMPSTWPCMTSPGRYVPLGLLWVSSSFWKTSWPFHSTDHASYLSHLQHSEPSGHCSVVPRMSQGTHVVSLKTQLLSSVWTQPSSWWLELKYTAKCTLTWAKWLQPSEG